MIYELRFMKLLLLFLFIISFGNIHAQTKGTLSNHVCDSIQYELLLVDNADQAGRNQMDYIVKKYGWRSEEYDSLLVSIRTNDSIDLIKVESIINQYGWLGANRIGQEANTTLFMVIQHSDLKVQERYLPLMQEAVKKGNARARDLALLEDRVSLQQGKKQIYGSQVSLNYKTNKRFVMPLEDPDNVDKRRADVGLQPIALYLRNFGIDWNVEEYKKELPSIEAAFFKHSTQ